MINLPGNFRRSHIYFSLHPSQRYYFSCMYIDSYGVGQYEHDDDDDDDDVDDIAGK